MRASALHACVLASVCCSASFALADAALLAPDLETIRYRDPTEHRQLWLGLDVGGVYVPKSLGIFNRNAWTARGVGSWALALSPRVAAGGRHGLVFYDATNIRLQVQEHQVELSARFHGDAENARTRDRLFATVEFHTLERTWVDGEAFSIGGVSDQVAGIGYGATHRLSSRWDLGWTGQARWAWVFIDTQRQLRASLRPSVRLGNGHHLALEGVAFLVHRNADQYGKPLARTTLHAQLALQHGWLSDAGVGTFTQLRYATAFMSGQAPMYEIREEAINAHYAELQTGVRVVW